MRKPYEGMNKKRCCMFCGCHLAPYSESDICEVCLDERYGDDLDDFEEVLNECY